MNIKEINRSAARLSEERDLLVDERNRLIHERFELVGQQLVAALDGIEGDWYVNSVGECFQLIVSFEDPDIGTEAAIALDRYQRALS